MSTRMHQVDAVIGAEVSLLLGKHHRAQAIATVTGAKTSADLSQAIVWVSLIPWSDEQWEAVLALVPEVQAGLAERLTMKRTPKLSFRPDRSGETALRVDQLLKEES